jgi:PTS system ascorbate-specific IIC component
MKGGIFVQKVLQFITAMLSEPALLMGLVTCIGLLALKCKWYEVLAGAFGPILGYLMIGAGAGFIVEQLTPLGGLIESGFHITGIVPNNEAITATAQNVLGLETMAILVIGLLVNLILARFTVYKYVFLTGHHSFFMACLLSAVLNGIGLEGILLIAVGGFFLGVWSAVSPRIGAKYTRAITGSNDIALGHFGSIGYALAGFIGELWGNKTETTEDWKIPDQLGFLRNTTISTGLIMIVFYLVAVVAAGPEAVAQFAGANQNPYLFAVLSGLKFAVGVAIVYNGVRLMLADLLPAFQGIAEKIIPQAIPAVDCAVFFPYAPTAVSIGFAVSFLGGLIGMFIFGAIGGVLIIPGLVPHFFCGATAAIYGNATGGWRGAVLGSFVNGLLLAFLPALLLPVLGTLGFANTTFGDVDFAVIGLLLGHVGGGFGVFGILALSIIVIGVIFLLHFQQKKGQNVAQMRDNEGQ